MRILLATAFALFAGLMMTRVFKYLHLKLPDVTAFLIAGVIVGPFCLGATKIPGLGFDSMEDISQVAFLSNVALGFIAFDIGNEFRLAQLRQTGKTATVIGIIQAVTATILVDIALIILHFIVGADVLPLPVAITLGSIAAATAPAATLMVVRQYKANSLVLGAFMGTLLTVLEKMFFSNSNRLSLTISFVIMTIALASVKITLVGGVTVSFSSLLVCMMLGTMFCNLSEYSTDIMQRSSKWTAPLYAVFFVISGSQLDLSVFRYPVIILIGAVYIIVRCLGKYIGARLSSSMMHCSETVRKYLGVTLFPQAGVALGMVVSAQSLGAEYGSMIRNIILFSVLVYELVGPMLTKISLERAGEITTGATDAQNRARFEKKKMPTA